MENTNSKSKRSIALLLALCMLTSFCSYTIAKYMTIGEGNDFARVAKWGITFDKGSSEMFATTYNTGVDGKGTKVVAPGTSGSGTYILEGTPETAYEITFNTEGTSEVFLGKGDWKYVDTEGYSDLMNYNNTDGEIYYPIKYTVTLADTVGTVAPVVATEDFLAKNVPTVFNNFAEAAKIINNTKVTFNPNTKCDAKITVNWAWAFDGQNDAADTILGDLAAKNPDLTNVATAQEGTDYNVNISYKFSLTAKQIQKLTESPQIEKDTLDKNKFVNNIPISVETLIFDDYSNYKNVITLENGITVDEEGEGDIKLFNEGNTTYVLNMNDNTIFAPENSIELFIGNEDTLTNLTTIEFNNFDTSSVTNMNSMFYDCISLESLDLSNFDTSNVTNMESMFYSCYNLVSLDLSSFDTSNVTDMSSMFDLCSDLTTIYVSDKWNTDKVTSSDGMFYYTPTLRNYDSSITDVTKAHTGEDGYLTLKTN